MKKHTIKLPLEDLDLDLVRFDSEEEFRTFVDINKAKKWVNYRAVEITTESWDQWWEMEMSVGTNSVYLIESSKTLQDLEGRVIDLQRTITELKEISK